MIKKILITVLALSLSASAQSSKPITINSSTGALIYPPAAVTAQKAINAQPAKAYEITPVDGGNITLTDGGTSFYTSEASSGTIVSPSTITLPQADAYPAGTTITISDNWYASTGAYLTFVAGSGDTILVFGVSDGSVPIYLGSTGNSGWTQFISDGVSQWKYSAASSEDWYMTLQGNPTTGYNPANVSITGGSISELNSFLNTSISNGAALWTPSNFIVPLSLKIPVTSTADIQQWYFGASKVAYVNYIGTGTFGSVGIGGGGNYISGGVSWILRTGVGTNTLQLEGGSGDNKIDSLRFEGLANIEVEGDTADDHETTISFQEPTGNDTNYRFAKSATTTTGDVVSVITKTDTGDPTGGYEGQMCINTFDTNVKIYAGSAWRTVADW